MIYENEMKNLCPGHCAQQSPLSQVNSCLLLYTLTWDGAREVISAETGTTASKCPGQDVCWFFTQPYFWWWCPSQGWKGRDPNVYNVFCINQGVHSWESNKLGSDAAFSGPVFFLPLFPNFVHCPFPHFYPTVSVLQHQHPWALGLCR